MPQPFNNAVMTNAGANLLIRAQAGEIKIEFTRVSIGDGNYTDDEKELYTLQKLTELKSLKNSFPLSSINVFSERSIKVTALITNQDPVTGEILVDTGYYINEMGLFAKVQGGEDSTEILYSIAITAGDKGDFMPPYNGFNPAQIIQEYYATVDNSQSVTIQNNMGAAALADDMEEALSEIQEVREQAFQFGMDNKAFYRGGADEYEIITNITASAGSEETESEDGKAINAIDGNVNTYWHTKWSEGPGKADIPNNIRNEFTIDLKGLYKVSKIEYLPRIMPSGDTGRQNGRILRYGLYYSKDGIYFHLIKEGMWENTENVQSTVFQEVEARKIQIRALETAGDAGKTNKFICAAEFRVYSMKKEKVYLADQDHSHVAASETNNGFMSSEKFKQFNELNQDVKALQDGKADIGHSHETVNGHNINSDVPPYAVFTDTGNIGCIIMTNISTGSGYTVANEFKAYGNVSIDTTEHEYGTYIISPNTDGTKIVKIKAVNIYGLDVTDSIAVLGTNGPDIFGESGNEMYLYPTNHFEFILHASDSFKGSEKLMLLVYMV